VRTLDELGVSDSQIIFKEYGSGPSGRVQVFDSQQLAGRTIRPARVETNFAMSGGSYFPATDSSLPSNASNRAASRFIRNTQALAISSLNRNSRRGVSLPHTVTELSPLILASCNLRINAGITWLFSGW